MRSDAPRLTLPAVAGLSLLSGCGSPDTHAPHDWRAEPHHLSTLVASTNESDESAVSLGLDYEYRVSRFLGLGAVAERAFGDIDGTLLLAVADLHFTDHLIAQTGPGVDHVDGEWEIAYRVGCLYEFERHGYTISPQLHYDWTTGEDAVIVGVAIGVGF